ncbi:prolyl oligopeptidase family serine peptidase [Pseudomonas typographi]|uniref:prolyl oligopeptidase family serine peptidase n=1 Tax=Pseudomonas typographi TaxID=2715964 RepID=UPI001681E77B|nr:prolyl oligopeptidase family serine peptidase [Pseudomonas typographi]MBD1553965.1 S9 family peptidase [Pseudomonas typographi]
MSPPLTRRLSHGDSASLRCTGSRQRPVNWLRSASATATRAYLGEERAYFDAWMDHTRVLQGRLFEEIKGRYRDADASVPQPFGGYLYYFRKLQGESMARYYRCRHLTATALEVDPNTEQLLLDPNAMANGAPIAFGAVAPSPDQRYLAYSVIAAAGSGLFIQDLATGLVRPVPPPGAPFDGSVAWAADSHTLFFATATTQHSNRLYRYRLGEALAQLAFEEHDNRFNLHCSRSRSGRWLILRCASKTSSETWVLDARAPERPFACLLPRQQQHKGVVDHGRWGAAWHWFDHTSAGGAPLNVRHAPDHGSLPSREQWQWLAAPEDDVAIEGMDLNHHAVVLSLRKQGRPSLEIHRQGAAPVPIQVPDDVYLLGVHAPLAFESPAMLLVHESLATPRQVRWLDLATGEHRLIKQMEVLGNFASERYTTLRLQATSPDGTGVPISLVLRKDHATRRPLRVLLTGYGAYGVTQEPAFSYSRLSLIDRGFAVAIAHVRGGGLLGEPWHAAGKGEHKQNSIDDFIACAHYLLDQGWTTPEGLAIRGESAGGLLIGATLNQRPGLCKVAVAHQPFVDPLTAMLDPSLPLTTTEYGEWGDPREPHAHAWIKAYSPYENVAAQAYPALLVTAGFQDPVVPYWQPAKWVAKLRASKTDSNPLLFYLDLQGTHGAGPGRYERIRRDALEYAFIFHAMGLAKSLLGDRPQPALPAPDEL